MLIKYQALAPTLQKKMHAIYVLVGNDPYLLNDAAVQIKQAFSQRGDCSSTTIDINAPEDWSLLINEAYNYSLFNDYVLLDARLDKKAIDAAGKERLTHYLTNINDRCLILCRAPIVPAKSLQWLIDNPNVIVVQIYPLTDLALKQWISSQLATLKIHAEPRVIAIIQQYTQGNMLATAQLIEKLSLHCAHDDHLTESLLKEHLSDQSHFEVYELAEACLDANALKAIRLIQQSRLERVEATHILWSLSQEIRLLIQLNQLLQQSFSIDNACNQLKIWSSRVKLYAKAVSRLSLTQLYKLLHECSQLDEMIKTSQTSQVWNKFDMIALSLCGINSFS